MSSRTTVTDGNFARVRYCGDAATGGCLGTRWEDAGKDGAMHLHELRSTEVSVGRSHKDHGIPDQQGSARGTEERHTVQGPSQQGIGPRAPSGHGGPSFCPYRGAQ